MPYRARILDVVGGSEDMDMDARFAEGPDQQFVSVDVLMIPEEIGGGDDHGGGRFGPLTVWYYGSVLSSLAYVVEFVLPQEPVIWGKRHLITEDRSLSVEPVRRFVTAQWSGIVDDDPFVVAVKCGRLLEWELESWEFGYAGPASPPPVSVRVRGAREVPPVLLGPDPSGRPGDVVELLLDVEFLPGGEREAFRICVCTPAYLGRVLDDGFRPMQGVWIVAGLDAVPQAIEQVTADLEEVVGGTAQTAAFSCGEWAVWERERTFGPGFPVPRPPTWPSY